MAQSFKDWEWIIVDDHSSDGSFDALRQLPDCRKIKIVQSQNRLYCGGAYDLALQHATGDLIGVVDIDDALIPTAMKEVYDLYQKYPDIDYIYTQHDICNKKLRKFKNGVSSLPQPGQSFAEMAKVKRHCFSHWRTFRHNVKDKSNHPIFKPGMRCCVDKNLGLVLEECGKGGFHNKALYLYRWYSGNLTSVSPEGSNKKRWMKIARQYRERREVNETTVFPVKEVFL